MKPSASFFKFIERKKNGRAEASDWSRHFVITNQSQFLRVERASVSGSVVVLSCLTPNKSRYYSCLHMQLETVTCDTQNMSRVTPCRL